MRRVKFFAGALALALVWCQSASAHFLWIVAEDGQPAKVKVYFGESAAPDDPELLDRVLQAEVFVKGFGRRAEATAIKMKKGADALEGQVEGGLNSPVFLRHTYGAMTRGNESFLLKYYAKTYPSPLPGAWSAVNDAERLPLEITPKLEGHEVILNVTWKGEPVADVQLVGSGPGLDKFEATTDDKGQARCSMSQAGVYSLRAKHTEQTAGELDGKAYASIRHYSTLTLSFAPPKISANPNALAALPQGTTSFGGAIVGDDVYVYGGNYGSAHEYANDDQSGDLWHLNLARPEKWEQLPGGPKLQGLAMVAHNGKLYRVGGFTAVNKAGAPQDLHSQTDFAAYDPQAKTWTNLPALPEPRSSLDAAVLGNTLYVIGGWNMQGQDKTVWAETAVAIDLDNPTHWKAIANPPFKRRAMAVAAFEGKLYCLGGMQEKGGTTTASSVFDPQTNSWADAPALLGSGMDGFGAATFAVGNSLYATTMSGSIQRLAAGASRWEFLGQLEHPRFFHRMLPWGADKLVVVGGASMTAGKITATEMISLSGVRDATVSQK